MSVNGLYSIYDRKAQYYLPAFQADRDITAHRQFNDLVVTSDMPISRYPADFDLIRLGTIDTETGEITPEFPVGLLINGLVALEGINRERARYASVLSPSTQSE